MSVAAKSEPHALLLTDLRGRISRLRKEGGADGRVISLTKGYGGRESVGVTAAQARSLGFVMTWSFAPLPLPSASSHGDLHLGADDARNAMSALRRLRECSGIVPDEIEAYSSTTFAKAVAIERCDLGVEMRDLVRWAGWFDLHLAFVGEVDAHRLALELDGAAPVLAAAFARRLTVERSRLNEKQVARRPPEEIVAAIEGFVRHAEEAGMAVPVVAERLPETLEGLSRVLATFGLRLAIVPTPGVRTDVAPDLSVPASAVERLAMAALRRIAEDFGSMRRERKVSSAKLATMAGTTANVCTGIEERPWGVDASTLARSVEAMGCGLELRPWNPSLESEA